MAAESLRGCSACGNSGPISCSCPGTDGGTKQHLIDMAEVVRRADPRPRFGDMKLPIIYAGNVAARSEVSQVLGETIELKCVDNLRPTLDRENLDPARDEIHEMFLEHVMQQAPDTQSSSNGRARRLWRRRTPWAS